MCTVNRMRYNAVEKIFSMLIEIMKRRGSQESWSLWIFTSPSHWHVCLLRPHPKLLEFLLFIALLHTHIQTHAQTHILAGAISISKAVVSQNYLTTCCTAEDSERETERAKILNTRSKRETTHSAQQAWGNDGSADTQSDNRDIHFCLLLAGWPVFK